MKSFCACFLFFAVSLTFCSFTVNDNTANYETIPLPQEVKPAIGEKSFHLDASTVIAFPEGNYKMERNARFLADYLKATAGLQLQVTSSAPGKNAIILKSDLKDVNPESYSIRVRDNAIVIDGASEAGNFYGIQTLRKSTPVNIANVIYPAVDIYDYPRFGYRGVMLDVSRHFFPVDLVKQYIDILALHNINHFHWHLSDNQGWRIEIKKYPKLTEIGSQRKGTILPCASGYDSIPYGGFYTQDQVREIVKYASDRYITVIPEIDMPGHIISALAAYPELGCTGGPYEVSREWEITNDVLCIGKESTFEFVENVLTELMDLFPSEYIHIGGDECPKTEWVKCPNCQARIKELGIKSDDKYTAEHYLQTYFTARIEKFLNDHGRKMIGWDEILEGQVAPNATVMSWRGMEGGVKAAKMNHDVVMTPYQHAYFDYYQSSDFDNEPCSFSYLPIERVYDFDPVPAELTVAEKKHILGAQANMWTEHIPTLSHAEYMLLPRLAAMSEVQWMKPENKNYNEFLERLPRLTSLYQLYGYNYAKHVYYAQVSLSSNKRMKSVDVTLKALSNNPVYYTLDNSEPTTSSILYKGTFHVRKDAELKAASVCDGKITRVQTRKFAFSKASFKPVNLLTVPAANYSYAGAGMLTDGVCGEGLNFRSGFWIGYQNNDMEAVVDMEKLTSISSVSFNSLVVKKDYVFGVRKFTLEASKDGKVYFPVASSEYEIQKESDPDGIVAHSLNFKSVRARYFKIRLEPFIIPDWHPGKGTRGFFFVDEIEMN